MQRIRNNFLLFASAAIFLISCERVGNLHDEFQNKGYRFKQLFGEEADHSKVLGSYVYNEELCMVFTKDSGRLVAHFLENGLDDEDVTVPCELRVLGKQHWLFFKHKKKKDWIGCRIEKQSNGKVVLDLPRISIRSYVEPEDFVVWLKKNPRRSTYKLDVKKNDSVKYTRRIPVFQTYYFASISETRAYEIRDSLRRRAMKKLFAGKNTIEDYEKYNKRFPGDPLLSIIEKNIFNTCGSSQCYERFIARFPNSRYVGKALEQLGDIEKLRIERDEFHRARLSGTMDDIDRYITAYPEGRYIDSAYALIIDKAGDIAYKTIDKKWAEGNKEQAYLYAVYKLKYDQKAEKDWCIRKAAFFAMQEGDANRLKETEEMFHGMTLSLDDDDARLCAQTYWAFMAWYRSDSKSCITRLESKVNEVYVKPKRTPFRKRLRDEYARVKDWKVELPDEKSTWKRIKKL